MTKRALPIEAVLPLSITAIRALLAVIYQFSPSLSMPGYVRVWGAPVPSSSCCWPFG